MVYFLVDGGMGDSVQITCQNVSTIIPNNVQHITNHLSSATTLNRIVQHHQSQSTPSIEHGTTVQSNTTTKNSKQSPTKTQHSTITASAIAAATVGNRKASFGNTSNCINQEYLLKQKISRCSITSLHKSNSSNELDESDEDEVALYPLSNQVSTM